MADAPSGHARSASSRQGGEANLPATASSFTADQALLQSVRSAFGRTRLRTLVSLRWMAIAGQALAVLFVNYGLGFELPL
ncbi:MAG: hypothetical protein Q8R02_18190, partial [Hyphomonadaceae bacterium]|nr:hypothetical protein [Hyphomonadaceae bacterium]